MNIRRICLCLIVCLMLIAFDYIKTNAQSTDVFQRAKDYEAQILNAAKKHNVDPYLLWTIAYLETRFQPNQISPKGAKGLMQFMPGTAARYGLRNPFNSIESIDAAARYVKDLKGLFGNRGDLILAGYNAGEGAVIKYGYKVPPYMETRGYVQSGKAIYNRLIGASFLYKNSEAQNAQAYQVNDKKKVKDLNKEQPVKKPQSIYVVEREQHKTDSTYSVIRKERKALKSIYSY